MANVLSWLHRVVIGEAPPAAQRWTEARDVALKPPKEFALAGRIVATIRERGPMRIEDLAKAVGRSQAVTRRSHTGLLAWRDVVRVDDPAFEAALKLAIRDGLIRPRLFSHVYAETPSLEAGDVRDWVVGFLDEAQVADVFLLEDAAPRRVRGRIGASLPWLVRSGDVTWSGPRVFSRGEIGTGPPPGSLAARG